MLKPTMYESERTITQKAQPAAKLTGAPAGWLF